jgi:hypothetical protein
MTRVDPALERRTRPIRDAAGAGAEESGISSPAEVGALSPKMGGGAVQRIAARTLAGACGQRRELGFERGSRGGRRAETV